MTISENQLDRRLRAAPRAIEPGRDLWPGIRNRLRPARSALPRLAVAVLVAAALVLAVLPRGEPPLRPGALVVQAQAVQRSAGIPSRARREALLRAAPTDHTESLLAGLHENRRAIDSLRQALRAQPDNPAWLHGLAAAERRQSALWRDLATLYSANG